MECKEGICGNEGDSDMTFASRSHISKIQSCNLFTSLKAPRQSTQKKQSMYRITIKEFSSSFLLMKHCLTSSNRLFFRIRNQSLLHLPALSPDTTYSKKLRKLLIAKISIHSPPPPYLFPFRINLHHHNK